MDDPQELALAAFFDRLTGAVKAFRNPDFELQPEEMPAVVQVDGGDDIDLADTGADAVDIRVSVGLFVAGGDGVAVGEARRALRWRVRSLFARGAGGDPTLGGAAVDVRYAGSADPVEVTLNDGRLYSVWVLDFRIRVYEPV